MSGVDYVLLCCPDRDHESGTIAKSIALGMILTRRIDLVHDTDHHPDRNMTKVLIITQKRTLAKILTIIQMRIIRIVPAVQHVLAAFRLPKDPAHEADYHPAKDPA